MEETYRVRGGEGAQGFQALPREQPPPCTGTGSGSEPTSMSGL